MDIEASEIELRRDLAARGPAQAARFTWRAAAQATLACLERAANSRVAQWL